MLLRMAASADPYVLASTTLTPEEHLKLVLVTYDPSAHPATAPSSQDSSRSGVDDIDETPPAYTQRLLVIVSNVSGGVEQSCVLVIKPRRKDPNTAALLSAIPILPDLKIEIEPQQGLTASVATPRRHPPTATTLGLSSLSQNLPAIHALLESVVPDLFASDKIHASNATLKLTLSHGQQSAMGITRDAHGLKDFLSVLKDLLKIAQEHGFSSDKTHQWMSTYTDDISTDLHRLHHHHPHHHSQQEQHDAPRLDTRPFSRFSRSALLSNSAPQSAPRPTSPTADDIRISVGTFNINGQWPQDDVTGILGLKKWIRAEEDPDLIVTGFQEFDTSGGAYLYYSPAREEAWTRAIIHALGRRADKYHKVASKQLVGLMILVFVRTSLEESISEVATASVGVGLGGFVANKGAVAARLRIGQRTICFVNSHLSAFEGLQAMERRCWDWNEIYKRLRFRSAQPEMDDASDMPAKGAVGKETDANGSSELAPSKEQATNPFKTVQDAQEEMSTDETAQQNVEHDGTSGKSGDALSNGDRGNGKEAEAAPPCLEAKPKSEGNDTTAAAKSHDKASEGPEDDPTFKASSASRRSSPDDDLQWHNNAEQPIMDHDVVIHFGDLNFRLDLSHSEAHRLIHQRQYDLLQRYDELESLRTSGSLFNDFEEGKITFAPTYKFDKGTDRYDTSEKQRVPAWTDRILWAVTKEWEDGEGGRAASATAEAEGEDEGDREKRRKQGVAQQSYDAVTDLKFSDHRPVRATFLVRIR